MQRLTGDFITSSEIGHLKKLGTVMYRSSLPIYPERERESNKQKLTQRETEIDIGKEVGEREIERERDLRERENGEGEGGGRERTWVFMRRGKESKMRDVSRGYFFPYVFFFSANFLKCIYSVFGHRSMSRLYFTNFQWNHWISVFLQNCVPHLVYAHHHPGMLPSGSGGVW